MFGKRRLPDLLDFSFRRQRKEESDTKCKFMTRNNLVHIWETWELAKARFRGFSGDAKARQDERRLIRRFSAGFQRKTMVLSVEDDGSFNPNEWTYFNSTDYCYKAGELFLGCERIFPLPTLF